MKVNPHIFRGYDIRGIVDKDLTPEIVLNIGKAHGTYLKQLGHTKAVVGRDCRQTSPLYSEKIIEGLAWTGLDVVDIGMQLIGTFYWSQHYLKIPGGVYVTASHNPPEFNGFKLANDYSETLVSEGIQNLYQTVTTEDYSKADKAGAVSKKNILPQYYKDLLNRLHPERKLKIVVDPSNTTAGATIPELLRKAGCEVVEYNTKIDPSFPLGVADPTETHIMERLGKEVLESNADMGFTYDADSDRIGIVDEKGQAVWNDVLLAIFAVDVLKDHPGATIMFNALCSKTVPETILAHGGKPFMWRAGHSFLKKKNQEVKAAFIGELSGHFFFSKDFYNQDDGAYSTLRLIQAVSRTNDTLSGMVSKLPLYKSSPQIHVFCPDESKVDLMAKLAPIFKKDFPDAQIIDDQRVGDGIRVEMADSMFVVRYSQNGPYIVIKFEARTDRDYEDLRKHILKALKAFPELEWAAPNKINVNIRALDK